MYNHDKFILNKNTDNLIYFSKKKNNVIVEESKKEFAGIHYAASNKEWYNTVYTFNKNFTKNLPVKDINLYKIFISYFNMKALSPALASAKINKFKMLLQPSLLQTNKNNDNKVENEQYVDWCSSLNSKSNSAFLEASLKKKQKQSLNRKNKNKKNRFSVKKTYISIPEIKHLNYKSISTVSVYSRENFILKKKIYKIFKRLFYKKKIYNLKKVLINNSLNKQENNVFFKNQTEKNLLFNKTNVLFYKDKKVNSLIYKYRFLYNAASASNNISDYKNNYFFNKSAFILSRRKKRIKYFISKRYKSLLLYRYYMLTLCFYKYKFNNNNLLGLRNIISKVYNKKSVFKLINLKYFYLDSNILASVINKKLKDRKKKVLIILKRALAKVKIHKYLTLWNGIDLSTLISSYEDENKLLSKNYYNKTLHKNIVFFKDFLLRPKKDIVTVILYNIKHKVLNGIRLQGAGRLTKRLTALRSISKTKYKGSLKNIDSSVLGLSTILLRGHLKSNLQYININSYNRNGSYSIKSSISSV